MRERWRAWRLRVARDKLADAQWEETHWNLSMERRMSPPSRKRSFERFFTREIERLQDRVERLERASEGRPDA